MKKLSLLLLLAVSSAARAQFSDSEKAALKKQAEKVTIVKDKWGVPHVYAKTDAQAVFGMMYVQCEEFFEKVEASLIGRTGRQAEVDGEKAIYRDLWTKIYTDSTRAKALYAKAPEYLQKLCNGFADGINYYMTTHPEKKPKLLTRIEPWMCLMNNTPSMSGSNISDDDFVAFYSKKPAKFTSYAPLEEADVYLDPQGSNGWALAPSRTNTGNAMLLINPHSEFYGRIEIQVTSKEGLNSYGAPFLGQFTIFQGFNEFLGWMHPVSLSDGKDLYAETIEVKDGKSYYRYNGMLRPVDSTTVTVTYKKGSEMATKSFTVYRTHHGPVAYAAGDKWVTLKTVEGEIDVLAMHWDKMKARNLKEFKAAFDKRVMTGSNVIYADNKGNIGYWHGNFVPKRDPALDWKRPVDGSTQATEWTGTYTLDEIPYYLNPANGWLQNCNSTILYATGKFDTLMSQKPGFMFPDGHTPRAMAAIRILENLQNAIVDDVLTAAHDPYLPQAARLVPELVKAYESEAAAFPQLKEPIETLKAWDFKTDTASVATTMTVMWVENIIALNVSKLQKPLTNEERYSTTNGAATSTKGLTTQEIVKAFAGVVAELDEDFGTWKVSWGNANRFQRNAPGESVSDDRPSYALAATPGYLGSLNAYVSKKGPKTKRRYGVTGNTFVAVVDFGKKLTAKTVLTGGASSDPASPHFNDQTESYINHQYKDIYFYKKDVLKNAEKTYHPGE